MGEMGIDGSRLSFGLCPIKTWVHQLFGLAQVLFQDLKKVIKVLRAVCHYAPQPLSSRGIARFAL